ncbi:VOC family protein [Alcaligenaceae bacterium]|nr:VOC family protein [Alcaligenaceae bacterium]
MTNISSEKETDVQGTVSEPYFRPRRLGHVNLIVNDTNASMDFYSRIAGFEEVYRVPAIGGGFLSNGNTHHDVGMVQSSGPSGKGRKPGLNHLAFELETEVDLVRGYDRSVARSLEFERTLDHDIAHSAYCADPDGVSCELYADVVKEWRTARTGEVTKPKPVWWPGKTEPVSEKNYHADPEIRRVADAVFHPVRTKHATLVVSDLDQSLRFYTTRIGLDALVRGQGYAILGGSCGEMNITLIQADEGRQACYHHVGFEVASEEELRESISKWTAQGGAVLRTVDHPLRFAAFIEDVDGLLLQFFFDRETGHEAWRKLSVEEALWVA